MFVVIPSDGVTRWSRMTWAALRALEAVMQHVGVFDEGPVVAFLALPLLSMLGAGRRLTFS